ncbi:MAG: hypothetical protein E2576_11135 [Alcaligenaceae bacterium]|nr:hypothetical protein [Alcaligenaceae bacterium SAGV5]MPS51238.1 hypothetical protein [Alcaligenaceae bacterium SAGV3]MPT57265.1 hypothetical protein [Alcaligenaceae bacterium]
MAVRPITDVLRHLRGGQLIDEASELLAKVVQAVDSTGKAGSITIKIKVKKISRSGALELIDTVDGAIPEAEALTTLMFPTPEGNLLTSDPRQQTLDLKSITTTTGPLRDVAPSGTVDTPLKSVSEA